MGNFADIDLLQIHVVTHIHTWELPSTASPPLLAAEQLHWNIWGLKASLKGT